MSKSDKKNESPRPTRNGPSEEKSERFNKPLRYFTYDCTVEGGLVFGSRVTEAPSPASDQVRSADDDYIHGQFDLLAVQLSKHFAAALLSSSAHIHASIHGQSSTELTIGLHLLWLSALSELPANLSRDGRVRIRSNTSDVLIKLSRASEIDKKVILRQPNNSAIDKSKRLINESKLERSIRLLTQGDFASEASAGDPDSLTLKEAAIEVTQELVRLRQLVDNNLSTTQVERRVAKSRGPESRTHLIAVEPSGLLSSLLTQLATPAGSERLRNTARELGSDHRTELQRLGAVLIHSASWVEPSTLPQSEAGAEPMTTAQMFGALLKAAREIKGWTVNQLAEAANLDRPNIYRYESGNVDPTTAMVTRFAIALNVSPLSLMPSVPTA